MGVYVPNDPALTLEELEAQMSENENEALQDVAAFLTNKATKAALN